MCFSLHRGNIYNNLQSKPPNIFRDVLELHLEPQILKRKEVFISVKAGCLNVYLSAFVYKNI